MRERLPNRRPNLSFTIACDGLKYDVTLGFYNDGRVGEIFVTGAKTGSAAAAMANDSAVLASISLQAGLTVDELRKSLMRDSQGRPTTPLGVALDRIRMDEV
jgi:hypothetical protein